MLCKSKKNRVMQTVLLVWSTNEEMAFVVLVTLVTIAVGQSLPHFEHLRESISNNSYIYYARISDGAAAVKCIINNTNCCRDVNNAKWIDDRGLSFNHGADGGTCLFVTRGDGVISLNRRDNNCVPPSSGVWRCDILDSNQDLHSLYIYIGNNTSYGDTY